MKTDNANIKCTNTQSHECAAVTINGKQSLETEWAGEKQVQQEPK